MLDNAAIELAPLYDQVPTALWPNLRTEPAMSIGPRVATLAELGLKDVLGEVALWPHDTKRSRVVVADTCERAIEALPLCDHHDVASLVRHQATRILSEAAGAR